jgi:hypothetical protein
MARHDKGSYELSDAEQRDLLTLIQQGKPLPERYRFILFEDKREVELVWNGKTRDVSTTVLPFQSLEHIDEPRTETKSQEDLFDSRGRQLRGWTNKLIWGDNKLILSSLKSGALRQQIEDAGGLKLIYIDPPFDVGADFSMDIEIGGETFHKEANLLEQIAYRDTWGRGADSFISMIYERLILMRDLMAADGSVYVHMGPKVNHLIRAAMDEIFGSSNHLNEIIWKRAFAHSDSKRCGIIHDVILLYAKGEKWTWNEVRQADDPQYIETFFDCYDEKRKKRYQRITLTGPGVTKDGESGRPWRGVDPTKTGRHWAKTHAELDRLDAEERIHWPKNGVPRLKRYEDEYEGMVIQDIWTDINKIHNQSVDQTGYDTQKPEALLERIIKASSNEGDLVADFFVGSGTTAAVAEKLGRKWIAADLGKFGIHTTRKRLIGVQRERKASEKDFRAFEVLNLGRYERQAYLSVGGRLTGTQKSQALAQKETEFRDLILRAYKATGFGGNEGTEAQDGFFHGARNGRLVVIGPINLPVGRLFVEEVITECRKRGASRVDVLAFEFEMGLFPASSKRHEARALILYRNIFPLMSLTNGR